MSGRLFYWVANWGLSRAAAATLLGGNVHDMIDCTHSAIENDHGGWLAETNVRRFAVYATGTPDIRATATDIHRLPAGSVHMLIDQSNSDLPLLSDARLVKDIEPGASGDPVAVEVARQRLAHGDDYVFYIEESLLARLENAVSAAKLPRGEIVAYQWASPGTNPDTVVPHTRVTLRDANVDLSVVKASFQPLQIGSPPAADPSAVVSYNPRDSAWTIHHA